MNMQLKAVLSVILILCMAIVFIPAAELRTAHAVSGTESGEFAGGDGSSSNPYLVSTPEQLNNVRYHLSSYFLQTCDIDMSSITNWHPIGNASSISSVTPPYNPPSVSEEPFSGYYNGNNYKILNLTIHDNAVTAANDCFGLFAALDKCYIYNVHLVGINFYINRQTTDYVALYNQYLAGFGVYAGGIAGKSTSDSTVYNCSARGTINVLNCSDAFVGGILGYGSAARCLNKANIYVNANASSRYTTDSRVYCGGIVGETPAINSSVYNCLNQGNIIATAGEFLYAGGISGEHGLIYNCMNTGSISGQTIRNNMTSSFAGNCNTGGIVGATKSNYVKYCVNYGDVMASTNRYASGAKSYAGGIVGYFTIINSTDSISCCVNIGGSIDAYKKNSSNQTVYANAGRIAGYSAKTSDCYANISTRVNGSLVTGSSTDYNGESVDTAALLTQDPYIGFNFSYTWSIDDEMGGAVLTSLFTHNECASGHYWQADFVNVDFVCAVCGMHQDISPVLGFEFGRDSFSFKNADVGSYDISDVGYYHMNPMIKLDIASWISRNAIPLFGYNGSCYGLAAMNASFYSGMPITDYGANTVSELSIDDADSFPPNQHTKLKDSINIMFFSQGQLAVYAFQNLQDGFLGGNNYLNLVDLARDLEAGDYLPIVSFMYNKDGGTRRHAVNIIGIMPDSFSKDYYIITAYDSNNPCFPSLFMVKKDYSSAIFVDFRDGKNAYNIESIINFITTPLYSIDVAAPGLRTSSGYSTDQNNGLFKQPVAEETESSLNNVGMYEDNTNDELITFIVPDDRAVSITTPSGNVAYIDENGVLSTQLTPAYAIPLIGLQLQTIILPYENGEYLVSSNDPIFININYNHNSATLYAEGGCEIVYSADGRLSYTPTTPDEYIEASYYMYGILGESDVMGFTVEGNVSNSMYLVCENDNVNLYGEDVVEQSMSVQHNDYGMTNEPLLPELDAGVGGVIVSNTDEGISVMPDEEHQLVPLYGDVDGDGLVAFTDIAALYLYMIGKGSINAKYLRNADFNMDGNIGYDDVSAMFISLIS